MKNRIHTTLLALGLSLAVLAGARAQEAEHTAVTPAADQRVVEIAICLDTSGSMSGLINAARQKLWAIVNDLALAKPTPKLRVALLTFGTPDYGAENGFVKLRTGLTEDLDLVSNELFALVTNGGDEYVARVLRNAVEQLDWTPSAGALKIIIVAGNEEADQDPQLDFRAVCKASIEKGIVVNSIYCGNAADNVAPLWREVARLADGRFASIDQDHGTIVIETPFDQQLASLSAGINDTYLGYGAQAESFAENQARQDSNAAGLNSAAAASRAQTKASGFYCNSAWDLVDACKAGAIKLEEIKQEDLPEELRGLPVEELKKKVEEAGRKRAEIQKQIQDLSVQRDKFVQEEMKKQAVSGDDSFDQAIRSAIREQAKVKGFQFQEPAAAPAEPAPVEKSDG